LYDIIGFGLIALVVVLQRLRRNAETSSA